MGTASIKTGCQRRPELFFSEDSGDIRKAKKLCAECGVATLTACFRQGLGSDIIAHKNGVTPGFGVYAGMTPEERTPHVKRWLEKDKAERGSRNVTWTPERLAVLAEGVSQGLTYSAIAAKIGLGVTKSAVRKRINRERDAGNI